MDTIVIAIVIKISIYYAVNLKVYFLITFQRLFYSQQCDRLLLIFVYDQYTAGRVINGAFAPFAGNVGRESCRIACLVSLWPQ